MHRSPQWRDGKFRNPQPIINDFSAMIAGSLHVSPEVSPAGPLPVEQVEPGRFATPPESGLRVTWFGHSSTLLELDGHR